MQRERVREPQGEITLGLGWTLNQMTGVLIKRSEDTEEAIWKRRQKNVKDCWQPLEPKREGWILLPESVQKEPILLTP